MMGMTKAPPKRTTHIYAIAEVTSLAIVNRTADTIDKNPTKRQTGS